MKHFGDITKLHGCNLPPVDCICGGSPCQDLSVAGKRAGLAGQRSGLYMEQIRIIREMRDTDALRGRTGVFIRPRYMVWENVPGAFSSNKGKDFAAVLEEAIRVAEPEAPDVPVPEKGWSKSGCLYDELGCWSVAWRVHDAQFWGVPQRRKRISLVADFGGLSAPEILFERKGLSGNPEQSGAKRESLAGGSTDCAGKSMCFSQNASGECRVTGDRSNTIQTNSNPSGRGTQMVYNIGGYNSAAWLDRKPVSVIPLNTMLVTRDKALGERTGLGVGNEGDAQFTLSAAHSHAVAYNIGGYNSAVCIGNGHTNQSIDTVAGALNCMHDQQAVFVTDTAHTLRAKANCSFREDSETYIAGSNGTTVRRLTPLECERLQGYPDGWTNIGDWTDSKGKKHKAADGPRFKCLGNSICLPFWFWLLRRISAQYERPATMGSLFDGIGGFPLCWERCNGKGTALWASEIEEFPIAVTKNRFSEDEL